jgi:Nucleotidyl transferase
MGPIIKKKIPKSTHRPGQRMKRKANNTCHAPACILNPLSSLWLFRLISISSFQIQFISWGKGKPQSSPSLQNFICKPYNQSIPMASSEERVVAVIMVGGPTKGNSGILSSDLSFFLSKFGFNSVDFFFEFEFWFPGTRFRPLSLNVPKPLFPLAGQPMVHHPISACRNVCKIAV